MICAREASAEETEILIRLTGTAFFVLSVMIRRGPRGAKRLLFGRLREGRGHRPGEVVVLIV
jgi:hypothetical protein